MGYQVIKQPDGDLAIWSSYSDEFVMVDAQRSDVIDWFVEIATHDARRNAARVVDAVVADEPRKIYAQFAKSWKDVKKKYPRKGTSF